MKRVQHGNSRCLSRTPRISKLESFTTMALLTALLVIVATLSILDVCGAPGYTSEKSAT